MIWKHLLTNLKAHGYTGKDDDLAAVSAYVKEHFPDGVKSKGAAIDLEKSYADAYPKKSGGLDLTSDIAESERKAIEDRIASLETQLKLTGGDNPNRNNTDVAKPIHITVGKDNLADDPYLGYGKGRLGDYFLDVVKAGGNSEGPGRVEKGSKLDLAHKAALSTYANENTGADGGFLVPEETSTIVEKRIMGEESLLPMCDMITVSGNSFTEPRDETTQWGTAGIQAYWEGEAGTYTQSKPVFNTKTWVLNKVTALVPATDEALSDATGLNSYINSKAPEMIDFKVGEAIVRGTGAGMPIGFLNSSGTLSVGAESNQPADTIKATNVQKMIMRMYAPYFRNGRFMLNPDCAVQLHELFVVAKTNAGTTIAAGGLVFNPQAQPGAPFGTLYGKPIFWTQHAAKLGDVGDITLADLKQYRAVVKTGGVQAVTSIHFWFDQGVQAFRFTFRMGGGPKYDTTITPRVGSNTLAAFVTVAAR